MIRSTAPAARRRTGFTLIELLTVIAIITVIAALGIGAYFRVRVSQEEKATETTLNKIQSEFDIQYHSVLDNAKDYSKNGQLVTNNSLMALAGNDSRRALVIWTKLQLRLEFPQNFWEAMIWPGTVGLQPKSTYVRALTAAGVTPAACLDPSDPANAAIMTPDRQFQESAVLLYLVLTVGRRGNTAFKASEAIGPHAIGKLTVIGTNFTFDVFKDTWGGPIYFIRWPFGGAAMDVNQSPYQQTNAAGQPIDPQDPEKTLLDNEWYTNNPTARDNFETLVNGKRPAGSSNYGAITNPPLNLIPVIFSAGRDKTPGLKAFDPSQGPSYYQRDPNPQYAWDDPQHTTPVSNGEDDNIYAHRIRGVQRGN